jgi:predicted unusual protein kinase regulating ubiquinone biosynthesis (AarF/ABC1/UbiB family)
MLRQRYFRILRFFAGLILKVVWWDILLLKFGFRNLSRKTRSRRYQRMAADFRILAVRMGGVMIKVGQFLSTRLDVLPREVTDELSGLQDEVQPETFVDIKRVIESEFQAPIGDVFLNFDETPMASASIGQVHAAHLHTGSSGHETQRQVVVKVQRPNIEKIVDTDLSAIQVVGRWLNAYPPIRKRANVEALIAEFSRTLYEEVDYLHEGKNAETFAKNFRSRPEVRVPEVYWERTTRRVLTLENLQGIKITDYAAIEAAGIDRAEVANLLFNTYLEQIFEDHFFHADPHPGNLFILPSGDYVPGEKRGWKLVFVDFGMAGTLSPSMVDALREAFIAIGTRDAVRLIKSYQMMGVLLPGADVDLLERANTRAFERFWGKSTQDLVKMGHEEAMDFLQEFGDLIYTLPFQIPEDLILLGRSMAILSGMCTGLNPEFNLWTTAAPFAEQLVASESGKSMQFLLKELASSLSSLAALPRKTESVLDKMEAGRLEVRMPQITDSLNRMARSQRRMSFAILFASVFLGTVQLYLSGNINLAWAALAASIIIIIFALR